MKEIDYTTSAGFVRSVGEDCLENLSEDDKEYIREHPYANDYHFGYAMFIRNHYIYNHDLEFEHEPDSLSGTIMDYIISKLTEYDSSDPFYWRLFGHKDFLCLRREYRRMYGEYPVELITKYHEKYPMDYSTGELIDKLFGMPPRMDLSEYYEGVDRKERELYELIYELTELVWNTDSIRDVAKRSGVDQTDLEKRILKVRELFIQKKKYIPMSSVLLPYRALIGEESYFAYRSELLRILHDTPDLIEDVDREIFCDRDIVKELTKHACAMRQLPEFQNDDEIVRCALQCNGRVLEDVNPRYAEDREWVRFAIEHSADHPIMYLDCMEKYRKDKEMVYLACRVCPWNFTEVDPSFQDDKELAYLVMSSEKYDQSISYNLSDRLKKDKELALLEARCKGCWIKYFSEELLDDDDIAAALMDNNNECQICFMSDRIRQKYGAE